MGNTEVLETRAAERTPAFVQELAEELTEHVGNMVKKLCAVGWQCNCH